MNRLLTILITLLPTVSLATEDLPCKYGNNERLKALISLKEEVLAYKIENGSFPEQYDSDSPLYHKNLPQALRSEFIGVRSESPFDDSVLYLAGSCYLERQKCQTYKSNICSVPLKKGTPVCKVVTHEIFEGVCK